MANVTATDRFFDDPRFDTAGVLLGVDGDLVRARMMRLWSWQTDNFTDVSPTYVVSRIELVGKLKDARAPEVLVECGLVEPRDGGFYVCGTEGGIEWLWKKKLAGARGGEVRARAAADAGRASRGRFGGSTSPSTDQAPTKHRPSTAPATDQASTTPCDPGSGIREEISLSPRASEAVVAPGELGRLVDHAVDTLNAARTSIAATSRPIGEHDDQPGREELRQRLRATSADRRLLDLDHCLAVLVAEAKDTGSVDKLRLGMLAGPKAWPRLLAGSATSRARAGPGGPRQPATAAPKFTPITEADR